MNPSIITTGEEQLNVILSLFTLVVTSSSARAPLEGSEVRITCRTRCLQQGLHVTAHCTVYWIIADFINLCPRSRINFKCFLHLCFSATKLTCCSTLSLASCGRCFQKPWTGILGFGHHTFNTSPASTCLYLWLRLVCYPHIGWRHHVSFMFIPDWLSDWKKVWWRGKKSSPKRCQVTWHGESSVLHHVPCLYCLKVG